MKSEKERLKEKQETSTALSGVEGKQETSAALSGVEGKQETRNIFLLNNKIQIKHCRLQIADCRL